MWTVKRINSGRAGRPHIGESYGPGPIMPAKDSPLYGHGTADKYYHKTRFNRPITAAQRGLHGWTYTKGNGLNALDDRLPADNRLKSGNTRDSLQQGSQE